MRRIRFAFRFIGFFGFLSIPAILNKIGIKPNLFCTWYEIYNEFWSNLSHHLMSLWTTFYLGLIAILIATAIGVFFGLLAAYYQKWLGFLEMLSKFVWSIPLIAMSVYLNIFIDSTLVYVLITGIFLGFYPILSFTYNKSSEPNDGILSMVASFNLSKLQEFRHFRVKEVLRNLVIPLSTSVPLTYIGITMGEYTSGRVAGAETYGLGSDFQFAIQYTKFPKVYVSIILMVFLVYLSGEFYEVVRNVRLYAKILKKRIGSSKEESG